MIGQWQKEIPKQSGDYWTASRHGELAGIKSVVYLDDGKLVYSGMPVGNPDRDGWMGWWWSVPVEAPPKPPKW